MFTTAGHSDAETEKKASASLAAGGTHDLENRSIVRAAWNIAKEEF
jgi:hypothetical protein